MKINRLGCGSGGGHCRQKTRQVSYLSSGSSGVDKAQSKLELLRVTASVLDYPYGYGDGHTSYGQKSLFFSSLLDKQTRMALLRVELAYHLVT